MQRSSTCLRRAPISRFSTVQWKCIPCLQTTEGFIIKKDISAFLFSAQITIWRRTSASVKLWAFAIPGPYIWLRKHSGIFWTWYTSQLTSGGNAGKAFPLMLWQKTATNITQPFQICWKCSLWMEAAHVVRIHFNAFPTANSGAQSHQTRDRRAYLQESYLV